MGNGQIAYTQVVALGGLVVVCLPGSNPVQDDGFLMAIITVARVPSEASKAVGPMS
jgi:hypothetical protein